MIMKWPVALVIAVITQISCQIFKMVLYSIRNKKIDFKSLISMGGFPSAHSAFVTSIATTMGIQTGFFSDSFAISATFGAIVIHDAIKLRGTVEAHSLLLNKITRDHYPDKYPKMREHVGHTLSEIIGGIVFGLIITTGLNFLLL